MGVHIFCTGGEDYVDLNDTLTFQPGERTKVVTVTILNDFLLEENETFYVSITADNDRVTVARSNSTVIIKDTDGRGSTQSKLAAILSSLFHCFSQLWRLDSIGRATGWTRSQGASRSTSPAPLHSSVQWRWSSP